MTTAKELITAAQAALTAEAVGRVNYPTSSAPAPKEVLAEYREAMERSIMGQLRSSNLNGVSPTTNITPDMMSRLTQRFQYLRAVSLGDVESNALYVPPEKKPTQQSIFCDALMQAAAELTFVADTPAPSRPWLARPRVSAAPLSVPLTPPVRKPAVAPIETPSPVIEAISQTHSPHVEAPVTEAQIAHNQARTDYANRWQILNTLGVEAGHSNLTQELTGSTRTPFIFLQHASFTAELQKVFDKARELGVMAPDADYRDITPDTTPMVAAFAAIHEAHDRMCSTRRAVKAEQDTPKAVG